MQSPFFAGAVVYAKDLGRVSRFYSELVGLAIVEEAPSFVVLESSSFQLVVVAMAPAIAAQITISSPPVRRENTALKLGFAVADLAAAREAAARLGGELNGPEREWKFQGRRVCDGHDPEGNVIQVRGPVL
jgi:predicted enzyme related to lactoylglutathione lyase